jgi:hypothetical protein
MLNQSQKLGLTILVTLGIVMGGVLPGISIPVPNFIAQALDPTDEAFKEGIALFQKKDPASLRQAIGPLQKALKLSQQSKNQTKQAFTLVLLARVYAGLDEKQKALALYQQ